MSKKLCGLHAYQVSGKWAQVVGIYLGGGGAIVSNICLKKGMIIRGNTVNFDYNFLF